MSRKNDQSIVKQTSNNLNILRRNAGLSAAQLAQHVGVSRQTIHAIEAGTYVPNTLVALQLARVLGTTVESIFALPPEAPSLERVTVLAGAENTDAGQPVELCRVDKRIIASPSSPIPWCVPVSDAILLDKNKAQIFRDRDDFDQRILIAGCDPGMSVLARYLRLAGVEPVLAHRNSSAALALLKENCVHVAGTHLHDAASGESNIGSIGRLFRGRSVAVVSFAIWEQGLVTARGNPKRIRSVEDLARPDVSFVNREKGAGSRLLLDSSLTAAGIRARDVGGYDHIAPGHLAAAAQVRSGEADCCIAPRAAAGVFGLDFVPLATERYDFVLHKRHLALRSVQILMETLSRASFRRDLEGLGGYDTKVAGARVL